MRPVRIVTGTAASAVTIAALGLLTAGPSAYADGLGAPRTGPAQTVARTDDDARDDESGGGADELFPLDVFSGRQAPSLLDAAGGGGAFAGFGDASGNGDGDGGGDGGRGGDRGDSSGRDSGPDGREPSGGRDSSHGDASRGNSSHGDSSRGDSSHGDSGRDSSGGRQDWSPSGKSDKPDKEEPGRHDGGPGGRETPGRDDTSSGHRPTGPTGHVGTGVGGSVRSDTTQIAAGAGVLAVAAVGGAWLLRRRASGTQGAG